MGKTRDLGNLVDAIPGPVLTLQNINTNTAIGRIGYDQTAQAVTIGDGSVVNQITMGVWSTYIPTVTGFSSAPTITAARYALIGKTCHVHVKMTANTSNLTTFTITLPFAAANTQIQTFYAIATDSGTGQTTPGRIDTRVNSNIADVYKNFATSSTWTASGNKGANFCIAYEIS